MSEKGVVGIRVNDDYCGRCLICPPLCPYEAITVDPDTDKVEIDTEKCQFCGICYSACPVNAIEIVYYDYDTLLKHVEKAVAAKEASTLVPMCRGNSPPTCEVENILKDEGKDDYIPLRVPCVGRIPPEFLLRALALGVKNIVAIRCEDDFCRFKEGSKMNNRRMLLTKHVLKELGYREDALKVVTYARKAVYDTERCVGCDKCVFICPYDAIEAEPLATPSIDLDKCVGCGACALVCPHLAIQVEGFEYETMSRRIQRYGKAAQSLRSQGVSPLILVFCCQWSEFSALDKPEAWLLGKRAVLMEIPCFKGLDPYLVVEALHTGFDGVLAVVCSDADCKLEEGYDVAERNAAVLHRVLKELSLQDRFELYTASPRNADEFEERLKAFVDKVGSLPALLLKTPQTAKAGVNA
jgi:coenzyme F420-reducing hydrogenase delta subunit/ferredoxin